MHFEHTVNEEELCIRVLRLHSRGDYLSQYEYLPPLTPGALLPSIREPLPWTWNHEEVQHRSVKDSVALHCLLHPTYHFPET